MRYEKRGRFWAVTDAAGALVCLTVYRKGAREVIRRLAPPDTPDAPAHVAERADPSYSPSGEVPEGNSHQRLTHRQKGNETWPLPHS